jgi:hypothetical protein
MATALLARAKRAVARDHCGQRVRDEDVEDERVLRPSSRQLDLLVALCLGSLHDGGDEEEALFVQPGRLLRASREGGGATDGEQR